MRNILSKTDLLFLDGLRLFNEKKFYDAHEVWEELWSEYKVPDSLFVQALIQLSVGFYHMECMNINGARGLFKKTLPKLDKYLPEQRGLNIELVSKNSRKIYKYLRSIDSLSYIDDKLYFTIDYVK